MSKVAQRSFAGGEISPSLYARVDVQRYASSLRTLRNFFVMRHGGAANRPGSEFICEVKDSTKEVRLIPFKFSTSQTYILEFGDEYMRVIKDGSPITEAAKTITGITNANPAVVTSNAHGYANGDEVHLASIVGAIGTFLNGRNFKVANVTANTFELEYMDGSAVNSTAFGSYTSGGTSSKIYEIATDYVDTDLALLSYVQSADVITIVHKSYAPMEISRLADDNWTISPLTFIPAISAPEDVTNTGGVDPTRVITNIVGNTVTTSVNHGFGTGDTVTIWNAEFTRPSTNILGYTSWIPKSHLYTVTVTGLTTFTIVSTSSGATFAAPAGFTYRTATDPGRAKRNLNFGGTGWVTEYAVTAVKEDTYEESVISSISGTSAVPSSGTPIVVSWSVVPDAIEYNIYKKLNGRLGFIGVSGNLSFSDNGLTPDTTDAPPTPRNPFDQPGKYPGTVTYVQQRLTMANSTNEPEKIHMSKSGAFKNFTTSNPIQDDDAVSFSMAGRQVNEVRHLLDLGQLIVLTEAGEHAVQGDSAGIIKPGEINPKQHSYNGADYLQPLLIDNTALYVQARGTIIRDLAFSLQSDGYSGNDLTIFSSHLFDQYEVTDWTFQQIPHSVVWTVRNDGTLLGLTYVREHEVLAWHRHDTDGLYKGIASIAEGQEDAVYVVVEREVNGSTKKFIERFAARFTEDVLDQKILDSFASYDGRNVTDGNTLTLTTGTGWLYTDTLTLTASFSLFSSLDVGRKFRLTGADGSIIRFTVTGYTNATTVTGTPHMTVPASLRTTATEDWSRAINSLTGLWHLEGKDVSVFADGFVIANPNNEAYDVVTIEDGTLTLDDHYSVIHVGLPITSDLQTLDIDTAVGEPMVGDAKNISHVTLYVEGARGIWVSGKAPEDDTLDDMIESKPRSDESMDAPVDLQTGTVELNILSQFNSHGRVFVRQSDPIPLSVLAIAPSGVIPQGR